MNDEPTADDRAIYELALRGKSLNQMRDEFKLSFHRMNLSIDTVSAYMYRNKSSKVLQEMSTKDIYDRFIEGEDLSELSYKTGLSKRYLSDIIIEQMKYKAYELEVSEIKLKIWST